MSLQVIYYIIYIYIICIYNYQLQLDFIKTHAIIIHTTVRSKMLLFIDAAQPYHDRTLYSYRISEINVLPVKVRSQTAGDAK